MPKRNRRAVKLERYACQNVPKLQQVFEILEAVFACAWVEGVLPHMELQYAMPPGIYSRRTRWFIDQWGALYYQVWLGRLGPEHAEILSDAVCVIAEAENRPTLQLAAAIMQQHAYAVYENSSTAAAATTCMPTTPDELTEGPDPDAVKGAVR